MLAMGRVAARLPRPTSAAKLGMVCLILGAIAAAEITSSAPADTDARPAENVVPSPSLPDVAAPGEAAPDFWLPPLPSFSEITVRPLFNETRRPALAPDQSGEALSSFVLKGVIVTPIIREALLLHNTPRTLVSLREGEMVDGWVAESILSDRVVFRNGNDEQELKLGAAIAKQELADRTPPAAPLPPARRQAPSL
jgi:hypothetical protein